MRRLDPDVEVQPEHPAAGADLQNTDMVPRMDGSVFGEVRKFTA